MNDIKFDKVGMPVTTGNIKQNTPNVIANDVKPEGVTVTNHLSQLVNLIGTDESVADDEARVAQMRSMVQSGDYKVNVHALADALMTSGVLRPIGN